MFKSTVALLVDYTLIIWSPEIGKSTFKKLDQIQRIRAQAITGEFYTVALQIAETEAGLQPILLCHYLQQWAT